MASDHDHGHHDAGGHELEAINNKLLFRLLISLSAVTLLACMAVIQWFNSQRAELIERQAAEGSFQLAIYKEEMAKDLQGIDDARKQILADPSVLRAPAAPAGWIHPDDMTGVPAAGGVPAPAGTDTPAAPAEPAAPTEAPIAVPAGEGTAPEAGEAAKDPSEAPIPVEAKPEAEAKPETKGEAKAETKTEGKPAETKSEGKPANE